MCIFLHSLSNLSKVNRVIAHLIVVTVIEHLERDFLAGRTTLTP